MEKSKIIREGVYIISEIVEGGFYVKKPEESKFKTKSIWVGRQFGKIILNLVTNEEDEVIFNNGDIIKIKIETVD